MIKEVKVLVVDDTYDKVRIVANITNDIPGCSIEVCQTAQEAIIKMQQSHYDLMIVDIQIPLAQGDTISPKGGVEFLDQVIIDENLIKPTHILGLTSHQESYSKCSEYFIRNGWHLILEPDNFDLIKSMIESKVRHSYIKPKKYDVAIITALYKTEFEQVKKLPINWCETTFVGDNNTYYEGVIKTQSGIEKSVIATSCSRMGMSAAAATAMKVCNKFTPDILIMTGISAGIPGKVNIGDILVADPCWDWGSGKKTVKENVVTLLNAPHQIELDPVLRAKFQRLSASRKYLDEIYSSWGGNKPSHVLNIHVGPVATGAVVLEDPSTVRSIISQNRETIGIEMEAYGACYAASTAGNCKPTTLILKSVCDFADPEKNDEWQDYAAYTSAQFAYKFLYDE